MDEVPTTTWSGVPVTVTARVVPRYAWQTTSIDVAVNGRTVLQTGGVLKVVGVHTESVEVAGAQHRIELSWEKFADGAFPFSLRIDGAVVLESRVRPTNAWVALWPYVLLAVLIGVTLARVFR